MTPFPRTGKGIHISDRKYFGYAPIAQAKAWLEGRDAVEPSDLNILRHYLWTAPKERTVIQNTLERMCNDPLKDRLDGILASALECRDDFDSAVDAPAARRIGKLRDEYTHVVDKCNPYYDIFFCLDRERKTITFALGCMKKEIPVVEGTEWCWKPTGKGILSQNIDPRAWVRRKSLCTGIATTTDQITA